MVLAAAFVVFCIVQDRGTSAGVGRYVTAQRAALAGDGGRAPLAGEATSVTIDEVMGPAVRASVRNGIVWGGLVASIGAAAIVIRGRGNHRG